MVFVCYSKGILLSANKESGKLSHLCPLLLLFWDVHIFMKIYSFVFNEREREIKPLHIDLPRLFED
jgi:hypothetical protein